MNQLRELHDAIKEHPYRLGEDSEFVNSYRKLLYAFRDAFWEETRNVEYLNTGNGRMPGFYHDFGWAIGNIPRSGAALHLENCISYIHRFIDTGRFDEYTTYNNGTSTKFVYLSYLRKHVPVIKRTLLDNVLGKIETYMSQHPENEIPKWGFYSKIRYDYYLNYKETILPLLEAEGLI